jgi:aryl-alcohol dehydrogenase-like predicted oxidoreductase
MVILRNDSDAFEKTVYGNLEDIDCEIIERVTKIAKQKNISQAQIAIAWLLHKPGITAPIIGATKIEQLNDAVNALCVKLTPEECNT